MNQKPRKLYCVKQPQWYLSGKLAFRRKHKCDHECMALVNQILADKPEKFYLVKGVPGVLSTHHSSYLVPLQLGFGRVLNPTGLCHYQAPCGRTLNTYAEIFAYLKKTKSRMAVDQFVLDPCVPLFRAHSPLKVWYYLPDMSRGKETLSIQAVNQHTTQQLPDFEYIPEMKFDLGLNSIDRISSVFERDKVCCDCEDDCEDAQHCPCRAKCKYGYDFMRLEKHSPYV